MTEQKKIEDKKLLLEKYYKQWRNLSWDKKEKKLKFLQEIDTIAETVDDIVFTANFRIRIAYSFPKNDYFEIAEKYFLKVVNKSELLIDNPKVLEITFEGIGDLYFENKKYDKACDVYNKLLEIVDFKEFIEEDILQMGIAFVNNSKGLFIDKAEELLSVVYKLSDEEMDHFIITKAGYWLGLVKYKLEKYKDAKILLQKTLIRYKRYNWDCKEIFRMLENIENTQANKPVSAFGEI